MGGTRPGNQIPAFAANDLPLAVTVFLIFLSCFFPLLITAINAVQRIPTVYVNAGRNFGLNHAELVHRVLYPAVLPQIMPIRTIPATTRSYRLPPFRASTIRNPRPEFTAIISAATNTSQATPKVIRNPVIRCWIWRCDRSKEPNRFAGVI